MDFVVDDVALIDEVQMLRCPDRGWAWTRALLGVAAPEVHVCGEEAGIEIVEKILKSTQDTFMVRKFLMHTIHYIKPNEIFKCFDFF